MSSLNVSENSEIKHSHEGHRARCKDRFLKNGDISDTDLLELFLFYSIPRVDTKKQAEELINKFGSLKGVFEADFEEISKISGLKENSRVLFALFNEIAKRTYDGKTEMSLFETEKLKKFLIGLFKGADKETVFALYFGADGNFLEKQIVFKGGISSVRFNLRTVTEGVIKAGGKFVVLAHNHPSGALIPSGDDVISTKRISAHLAANDIDLVEHYIVGKTGCVGIINVE